MTDPGTITRILNSPRDPSDPATAATAATERQLHREMRRIALGLLRGQGQAGMDRLDLGATVMVNEAWLRLERTGHWDNRAHFFGSAARAMRQILSREGRRRQSRLDRDNEAGRMRHAWSASSEALLDRAADVDAALRQLEAEDAQLAQIAVMKFYGDMPSALIADELGVSKRTIERRWKYAAVKLRMLIERERTRH